MARNLQPSPDGAKLFEPIPRFQVLAALLAATGWTGGQSLLYNSRAAWLACRVGQELLARRSRQYRFSLIDVRDAGITKDTA